MWGNLGRQLMQVAADVAQDLAQPQDEGADDDEYYEGEEEGWDDGLEDLDDDGDGAAPSWEEEQQEPEEGQYYATEDPQPTGDDGGEYYEGGEEEQYVADNEQPYNEEEYYDNDVDVAASDEQGGWAEEEVDFSLEAEQQEANEATTPVQEDQPLFGGDPLSFEEPVVPNENDWDLEDQLLFDEEAEAAATQQEEAPQELNNAEEEAGLEAGENENEWNDESLNFDDSHVGGEEETPPQLSLLPEETVQASQSQDDDAYANEIDEMGLPNSWDQEEDIDLDEPNEEEPPVDIPASPQENPFVARQALQENIETAAEEEGAGWDDDLDALNDSRIDAEVASEDPQTAKQETEIGETGTALEDDEKDPAQEPQSTNNEGIEDENENNNEWDIDDDLNFSSHHEDAADALDVPQESTDIAESNIEDTEQQHSEKPVSSIGETVPEETTSLQDSTEPLQTATQPSATDAEEVNADAWGQDDLDFSSQHGTIDPSPPQPSDADAAATIPEDDAWGDGDDLNLSDHNDNTGLEAAAVIAPDSGTATDAAAPITTSAVLEDEPPTDNDPSPPQPSDADAAAAIPEDNAWGDGDDLNLSDHNDNTGLEAAAINAPDNDTATDAAAPIMTSAVLEDEPPTDNDNAWGDDDLDLSAQIDNDADLHAPSDAKETVENDDVEQELDTSAPAEVSVGEEHLESKPDQRPSEPEDGGISLEVEAKTSVDEDAWNDSAFNLDEDELDHPEETQNTTTAVPAQSYDQSDEVDDDCTVERSNIGFEPSTDGLGEGKQSASDDERDAELQFDLPSRTPSRRATIRASNTSSACISRKGSEDEDSEVMSAKVIGTSVMFADLAVEEENEKDVAVQRSMEDTCIVVETKPSDDAADPDATSQVQLTETTTDKEATSEISIARDAVSSVSGDSGELPKPPRFQTQISMMTLKSIADSCPSSRARDNDSDEDDEDGFGPVVDKTPELDAGVTRTPELSTMTINSTAVAAHSVGDDIQRDDEMDGTYYGGSTAGEAQSKGSGWEDDASLEEMNDLNEKIVNFELADEGPIDASAAQPETMITPVNAVEQKEASNSRPNLDSSMANLYADDNSVPSRDKDDDNEENYKKVVDQIPKPLKKLVKKKSGRTLNSLAVFSDSQEDGKNDESTTEKEPDGNAGDGWEDSFLGDIKVDEEASPDDGALDIAAKSTPKAGQVVIDNTPVDAFSTGWKSGGSLAAVYADDNSVPSRDNDDDNEENYKKVVDQIPPTPAPLLDQMSVTASSVAVVANNVEEDLKQDEELDASDHGGSTIDGLGVSSGWENDCDAVDDLVAGDSRRIDDIPSASALSGGLVATDGAADGGGMNPNDDSAPPGNSNGQAGQSAVVLVDHTPAGEAHRKRAKGDASLAVLAPSEDGTVASMNGDDDVDTIDPHGERVSFGNIVDITPTLRMQPLGERSTAPSVTFSLAVEARSVEEDYNLDDEMDETFCGDTTLGGETGTGWADDQTLDDLDTDASINRGASLSAYKFQSKKQGEGDRNEVMVDHTPLPDTPQSRVGDASLVALAPSVVDTYHSDDDDADSALDDDTITREDGMMYGNVVDVLPSLAPLPLVSSNSMAVGASSADFRSEMEREDDLDATLGDTIGAVGENDGWDDDEEALDQIESQVEPEVIQAVDHTPVADEEPKPGIIDPSVAVLAPSEDGSREGDNDTCNDDANVFGPMVDHTPFSQQPPDTGSVTVPGSVSARHEGELEGTLFGDSTVGGETGWDEDDAALDDLVEEEAKDSGSVVVEPPSNVNSWQHSAELISDNASSHLGGSTIESQAEQEVIQAVDHTPSEIDSTVQKNSVAWNLLTVESGISNETDDAGVSWRDNEAAAVPEVQAEEDQAVVDHIPHGAASRLGDASTLVVADPSEVLSHVGDMLQEEGDFGPVVDLTPPSRLVPVLSAAGSTAVIAPTVGPDDLDADPDDTINAADENTDGWEQDASELEQAPNPQSGNEEEIAAAARARVREQVVDFLPPQEEEVTDRNRDGWSEVATGGAPSVLQADPKEDEFGPVVDQLPAPHPSTSFAAISTTSQVASSECDEMAGEDEDESNKQGGNAGVLVDPLPRPFEVDLKNLDSTASLAQSLASEDEDDDIKNYGPVVDLLPSIRSSLPPSRGGSTVDALATVSEVIDDDDDASDNSSEGGGDNGWGDDDLGDIDISERHSNVAGGSVDPSAGDEAKDQNSNQGDRGMTVRFRSVVAAIFESSSDNEQPQSNLPSSNATPHEIFHDDEAADADEPSAWDDDIDFDVTFNVGSNGAEGNYRAMMTPERLAQFSEADTPPATPYSRDKLTHREPDGLPPPVELPDFGPTGNPPKLSMQCNTCANSSSVDCPCVQRILKNKENGDDDAIKVDYNKLLQTEITKRRLIEEEANDLRQRLDRLKNSKTAGEVRMETVKTLQDHVKVIETKLKEARDNSEALQRENHELQTSLATARSTLSILEGQREQWIVKEVALAQESERAQRALNESLIQAKKNHETNERELKTEIESKQQFADDLSRQLGSLQDESSRLRTENESLLSDVKTFRESLEEKEREIARLLAQESQFEVETKELKEMIAEFEMANASAEELQELFREVQSELVSKDALCDQLNNDIALLEKRLQDTGGEQSNLENERASLRKQYEDDIASKQEQLASLGEELDELKRLRSQDAAESDMRLQSLQNEIDVLSKEKQTLEAKSLDGQSSEGAMSEIREELDIKQQELQAATEQVNYLQEQNAHLEAALEDLDSLSAKARSLEDELKATCEERDALKSALQESNEMVTRMQKRIDDQGIEESAMEQNKNKEIEALIAERAQLRNEAIASSHTIEALEQKSAGLAQDKAALETKISELTQSCEEFKTLAENSRVDAVDATEHLSKILTEFEALQQESAELEMEREVAESDRENMLSKISDLEAALNSALQDVSMGAEKTAELTTLLSEKQQEVNAVRNDADQFRAKCNDLEALLSGKTQESQELSRLMEENSSLFDQLNAVQQELGNQNIILQNFEERAAALENELNEQRNDGASKDVTIAALREELRSTRQNLELSTEGANKLPERIAELQAIVSRFESERFEFDHRVEVLVAKEQELHERNESLVQDRSRVLSDRESLAQENEEMLVQFGLLNEQMDSYREQVQELQQLVQSYEQTSAIADAKVLELQQRLVSAETAQRESSEQFAYEAEEKERELASIRNEQARLMQEIQELSEANSEKDNTIDSLTYELDGVKSQLVALEELQAQSDFVSQENEELHSKIEDLELQRGELAANVDHQQETIAGLANDLEDIRAAAQASNNQVKMLEEACSDRDEALQRKEEEIREMVGRLHASGGPSASESGEEILNLRTRLEQLDSHCQETVDQMHKLTADYEASQEELASTRAHLATLEESVGQLEQELAEKAEDAHQQSEDQENQILTLENKLQNEKREVAELTRRSATLSYEVETLRAELYSVREQSVASASATDEAESAATELLKERLRSLEEELEATKSSSREREESLQTEINGLKRRIGTKDGEVLMLKNKVEELRGEAQISRDQVEGKVVELQHLASEMDNMRKQQESLPERGHNISAVDLLEQSKENAEDVENLRATVISLATALETSENLRADAIDRLLKERETYASSLRHFSDSVKRFYHTLSFNE